jgi:ubiquinone/menaquinone biosynthesis C-methylase UbiE
VRRFVASLRERNLKRVLDLGCGAGRHFVFLTKEGFEAHGLDRSKEALELARRRLGEEGLSARLVRADLTSLPFRDGCLDAMIAIATLYHGTLSTMRQALGEIHRVLRPGGLALLEFKSKKSFRYGKGEEIEPDTFIAERSPLLTVRPLRS